MAARNDDERAFIIEREVPLRVVCRLGEARELFGRGGRGGEIVSVPAEGEVVGGADEEVGVFQD